MPALVAVRLPDPHAMIAAIDRVHADGDAVLPLDPSAPDDVVADLVRRFRPSGLVHTRPDGRTRISRLPDGIAVPAGTALVVATSGSSGPPRGIVLSTAALDHGVTASLDRLGATPGQRWTLSLPLHHVAGLLVVLRARRLGHEPVVTSAGDLPGDHGDWWALVPTMLRRLLDDGAPLDGRAILLGGAAAPPDLLDDARRAGAHVVTTYGMTETCGGCVYDGVPLDGVDVRTAADGRIGLRGPVVATGERGPDGTVAPVVDDDGWLWTNDLGEVADGRLTVIGRADDVIVTGGENVAAEAVANLLRDLPGVDDAAVIGIDDREWGQRVVALLVVTGAAPDLAEVRAHVAAALGAPSAPRQLVVVPSIPRTSLGKVARDRARALVPD